MFAQSVRPSVYVNVCMCKLSRAYEERHIARKERKTKVEIVRWSDRKTDRDGDMETQRKETGRQEL
jgi:hypothetical protein